MKRKRPSRSRRKEHDSTGQRADRKVLQLCSQVARTLEQVLAEQEADDLRDLMVDSVTPAPDGSHLLVTVRPLNTTADPLALIARLNEVASDLRMEVAGAITRRRAPSFTFRVVPPNASAETVT